MTIVDFTPATGCIGGLPIGVAASLLLWPNGRIVGTKGTINPIAPTCWRANVGLQGFPDMSR